MNRVELRAMLDREGVRRNAYSLDGTWSEAPYLIDLMGLGWRVCHVEGGAVCEERSFATEDQACSYLLNLLLRDVTTRALLPSQQDRRSVARNSTVGG